MKPVILSTSDLHGGAARATFRNHKALIQNGVASTLMVIHKRSNDASVLNAGTSFDQFIYRAKNKLINSLVRKLFKTRNHVLHSPAIFNSKIIKKINSSNFDLVHLQWINNEMMSIKDISKLKKPLVWTLHDMWAFCGAEHYTTDSRWKNGYHEANRPDGDSGMDLNLWTWNRKIKYWKKPIQIVAPSHWLAQCVKQSSLMKDWPVTVIPNGIDTEVWKPFAKISSRKKFKLPEYASLLLFGAMGGAADPRKGFDLLRDALLILKGKIHNLELVVFGQSSPAKPVELGFPIHYVGHVNEDADLNILYSAADALVIPSRQDNLPNTGVEALASGTPLLAFNEGGLPDLIIHKSNGYLAKAFDVEDLAQGIQWLFEDSERLKQLSVKSRLEAVEKYSYTAVGQKYKELYRSIIS